MAHKILVAAAVAATALAGFATTASARPLPANPLLQADASVARQQGYAEDMAAYRAALRAHHRAASRDQRVYDRQQRAYADAMAAWRRQVYACHHGSHRACNAPTPNPANYW